MKLIFLFYCSKKMNSFGKSMKSRNNIFLVTFITLFLLTKVTSLHVLGHDDNSSSNKCELCVISAAVGFTPLLHDNSGVVFSNNILVEYKKKQSHGRSIVHYTKGLTYIHVTRPPPHLIQFI